MAINYPTSLDTFTDPTATSLLTSPSHSGLHTDINSAVEALEYKVGIGNTVLGTFTTYTPTFNNLTVGNGTLTGAYCRVNDFVYYYGKIVLGSTTVVGSAVEINLPINLHSTQQLTGQPIGMMTFYDASAALFNQGDTISVASATTVRVRPYLADQQYLRTGNLTANAPFTWTTGDVMYWNLYYRAA